MIAWAKIILLGLQLLDRMLAYGQQQKWINEGKDAEIAKSATEVLRKTVYAQNALKEFSTDTDTAVDDFLRNLGRETTNSS